MKRVGESKPVFELSIEEAKHLEYWMDEVLEYHVAKDSLVPGLITNKVVNAIRNRMIQFNTYIRDCNNRRKEVLLEKLRQTLSEEEVELLDL